MEEHPHIILESQLYSQIVNTIKHFCEENDGYLSDVEVCGILDKIKFEFQYYKIKDKLNNEEI